MNLKIKLPFFVVSLLINLITLTLVCPSKGQTVINKPLGIALKPDPPFDIDGDLSEWNQVPNSQELTLAEQVVSGKDVWKSQEDLSAKVWLAWRDVHLYLAVDVKDDKIRQTQTNRDIWKGDHIEIYIDTTPEADKDRDPFGHGQFHIGLSPGNFKETGNTLIDLKPEAVVFRPAALSGKQIIISARQNERGYTLEAAIPWSMMNTKAAKNTELAVEVAVSDTDSDEPIQESMMTIQSKPWKSGSRRCLMPAMLTGADGKATAIVKGFDIFSAFSSQPEQKKQIEFNVPSKPADREAVLAFNARLDFEKSAGGYTSAMKVSVNDQSLDASRLINKNAVEERRSGEIANMMAGASFNIPYGNSFDSIDEHPGYGLKRAQFSLWEFKITDLLREGDNTITFENTIASGLKNALVTGKGRIEFRPPSQKKQKRAAPTGPIPVIAPSKTFKVNYGILRCRDNDMKITLQKEKFLVESKFSTPEAKWQKKTNRYFKIKRRVEKLDEAILISDSFTNLTNENLPIMQEHQIKMNPQKVWLSGLSPASGTGAMSESANPTSFGVTDKIGIGLMPMDDIFQVHIQNFATGDSIGIADRNFVLKPKATHTTQWAILPVAEPDYFAFVNAARRLLKTNFKIDGGFAFLRAAPTVSKWSDEQIKSFIDYKSVKYLTIPVGYPKYKKDVYAHGTAFQTIDLSIWKTEVQRRHRIGGDFKQLAYFHCFIDSREGADKLYADSRTLRSDGQQANYRRTEYPIFFPTKENSYGKAIAKSVDIILDEIGLDGVYWDEMEYSRQKYHYGQPWDGVSADIDLKKMKIIQLKSSITLLTQPWRLAMAKKIKERGELVSNGAPYTRAIAQIQCPRFTETGSISNCTRNHLYTPIALGDHLTERNEVDAYKVMLRALDYGCVYYWYNDLNVIPTHHHLTKYMYPITPMELGEGYIIGKERIITNRSGTYGWNDDSTHEVHVFDDMGYEIKSFKPQTVKRNGNTFTELRIAEDYSAAILRCQTK